MNFNIILKQAEDVSGEELAEPLRTTLIKILVAVQDKIIQDEIDFLNELLGNAKYENAVLTREEIIKKLNKLKDKKE